ncbi:hypothetical protein HB13667_16245 [Pseudomonas putida]|uniref:Uncharacterized protein n=1 Tax=Pseudomonas putida TaxID=303 RepID=A0A0P7CZM3_PSEPU|nr:hypothetical protein [Pseudomonas putida]KPM62961.1 hypothetical protein HB13667_16245 [Pseudomonas putida]
MMSEIEFDKEKFGEEMSRFLCGYFGVGELHGEVPMHEVRAKLDMVGKMLGRSLAVCMHDGPVEADIAFAIRASEKHWRERCLESAGRLCGPGGVLREKWSEGK